MDIAATLIETLSALTSDNGGGTEQSSTHPKPMHESVISVDKDLSDRLQEWNGAIEKEFMSPSPPPSLLQPFHPFGTDESSAALLRTASSALHERLVRIVSENPYFFFAGKVHADVDSSADEGMDGGVAVSLGPAWKDVDGEDGEADEEADAAASRVASSVNTHCFPSTSTSLSSRSQKEEREDDERVRARLILVSDVLRACKNVLRWTNQRRATMVRYRGRPSAADAKEQVNADPTGRLRRPGMLRLYLSLLDGCSRRSNPGVGVGVDGNGSSNDNCGGESESENVAAPLVTSSKLTPRDDVAQAASLALFHAYFGVDDPVPDAARSVLVGTGVSFVPSLARLLRGAHPLPLYISFMRHVHSLVGSDPSVSAMIDGALADCARNESDGGKATKFGNGGDEKNEDDNDDNDDNDDGDVTKKGSLAAVLVSTLAWAIRSDPPFPGTDPGDRRSDLAVEVLRIMFALQSREGNKNRKSDDAVMTQIGVLLCDILCLPNADFRVYDTKLAAVNLLMGCPVEYGQYLLLNGGIPPLLTVLMLQLNVVVVERTGSGAADTAAVVPILVTLTRLSSANAEVRRLVKEKVFPPEAEKDFQAKAREEMEKMSSGGAVTAKNMSPLDAQRSTIRWKLVRLMTWTETNVKRCASELLWTLCDEDATEFVLRTGFGNAVHMLGIKGLMALPKESFIG